MRKSVNTRMLRSSIFGAAALLLTASAGNAFGDVFTMTWTGPFGSGLAELTATPVATDEWSVTALSGTQDGLPVSLVAAGGYGDNDNDIYQPPDFPYVVDRDGLGFTDGVNTYNIFNNNDSVVPPVYHECSSAVESVCTGTQADDAQTISLKITPGYTSTVPEPAFGGPIALMVLGLAVLLRRKSAVS